MIRIFNAHPVKIPYFNTPLTRNKDGDPRIFFQVFAKNSLIKNIFEEEKMFDSGTRFFFRKIVPNWVYCGKGEDLKPATELSENYNISATKQSKTT